ncbi:hypothetical protein AB0T83_16345 [Fluviibacterium sp. DFM31]|uniref:Uncharacterized protein n=1 Tax=Meridianimarinicoccus marinus TaxID=3231483 RepID=A0ABV3L9Z5_9RHOB
MMAECDGLKLARYVDGPETLHDIRTDPQEQTNFPAIPIWPNGKPRWNSA